MKYLVLQNFRSYGVTHIKGTVVDESLIRSPRLRIAEGKIVPAVSSLEVPMEVESEEILEEASLDTSIGVEIEVVEESIEEVVEEEIPEEVPKKFNLFK